MIGEDQKHGCTTKYRVDGFDIVSTKGAEIMADEPMLSIKVDKRPISQAQLIGFIVILMGQAFVGGGLYYKFTSDIANAASKADLASLSVKVDSEAAARQTRSVLSDRNFDDIQKQLKPLDTVTLRLDQQDKRDDAQDVRIDRLLDLMGAKFDGLTQSVAEVKADVRVVAQDVKNLSGKTQPTAFRP